MSVGKSQYVNNSKLYKVIEVVNISGGFYSYIEWNFTIFLYTSLPMEYIAK